MSTPPEQPEFRLEHTEKDIQDFNEYLLKLFQQEGNLTLPLWLFDKEIFYNLKQLEVELCCFEEAGYDGCKIKCQLQVIKQSIESRDVSGTVLFGAPGVLHMNRDMVSDDTLREQLCGPECEQRRKSFYHSLCGTKLLLLEAMGDFNNLCRQEIDGEMEDLQYENCKQMDLERTLHAKMDVMTPYMVSGWGGRSREGGRDEYSVFISHAGEDKTTLAVPIHRALTKVNMSSFLDVAELRPGDDASASMLNAVDTAFIAVVVLSPEFGGKKWPVLELERFLRRRRGFGNAVFVIPVFYRISRKDCREFEMFVERNREVFEKVWLFDRIEKGETSVEYVGEVMREVAEIEGIECDGDEDGDVNELVERIVKSCYEGMKELRRELMMTKLRNLEARAERLEARLNAN